MARFGHYITVHELRRTGLTVVYSGRDDKSPDDKFAIKVRAADALFTDKEHEKTGANNFLNSAQLQQKIVARGLQHWAPIHEFGTSPDGTFYVTDKYEHSLEQLIDLHADLGAKGLHTIIAQITEGLIELKKACKRPHGNLKATNVFIAGANSEMKVALSDPLPDKSIDAKVHWYADLQAIGELIYQLVVHRPAPSLAGARISDSKEWARLKQQKDEWRDLCERLLAVRISPDAITLENLVEELTELGKSKPFITSRRVILSLLTIIAIIIVYWFWHTLPPSPEKREYFLMDYFSWIEPLYHSLGFSSSDKDFNKSKASGPANVWIKGDPDLEEIIGKKNYGVDSQICIAGFPAKHIRAKNDNDIIEAVRDLSKYTDEVDKAVDAVEYLREFFNPDKEKWPFLVKIHKAAKSLEKNLKKNEEDWLQPAVSYLEDLVEKVRPPNIQEYEGEVPNVTPKNVKIYEGVNEILVLKQNDTLSEIRSIQEDINRYKNRWPVVDKELLDVAGNYSEIETSEKFENYLNKIRGFRNKEHIHEEYKKQWNPNDIRQLVENLKSMPENKKKADDFKKELKKIETNFDELKQNLEEEKIYYIAKNEEEIKKRYEELMDKLENLWDGIVKDLNDPSDWLEDVDGRKITNSDALEKKWQRRRRELLDDEARKGLESDHREKYLTYTAVQPKVEYSWDRLNELQMLGTNFPQKFEEQLQTSDEGAIQIDELTHGYKTALEEAFEKIEYDELFDNAAPAIPDINESASFKYPLWRKLAQLNPTNGSESMTSATKLVELVHAYGNICEQFRLFYLLDANGTKKYVKIFENRLDNFKKDKEVFSEIFNSDSNVFEAFSILESKIDKMGKITKMQLSELRSQVDKVLVETDSEARDADYAVLYAVYLGLNGEPNWPKDHIEWDLDQKMKTSLQKRIETIRDKGKRAEELNKELVDIFAKRKEHFEKLKPLYCERLDLGRQNGQGILVFAEGIALRDKFEPVMDSNGDSAVISAWDEIRQAVDKQGNWIDFFYTTEDLNEKINVGWPKYIRSTKDHSVILRFIPAGKGNPEPFYMAIREITNRQYAAVVEYQSGFIKQTKLYLEEERSRLMQDGLNFRVVEEKWNDYPVTWVFYKGAKRYAEKLGAELPTAKQHEHASIVSPSDSQSTKYAHVRGRAWKEIARKYNEVAEANTKAGAKLRDAALPLGAVKPDGFEPLYSKISEINSIIESDYDSAWPIPVNSYGRRANSWGLYDLIGNVWEWCNGDDGLVICGGSCLAPINYNYANSTFPFGSEETERDVGFRIVVPARVVQR